MAINPVGQPIPTIPVKGSRGHYGPPKPMPYPPNKFRPPGPPPSYTGSSIHGSHYTTSHFGSSSSHFNGPPIRKGYTPSKPFYGNKPFLNGPSTIIDGDRPYTFDSTGSSLYQESLNKDKKVEVVVAQGNKHDVQQHVHHHFHHSSNDNNIKIPTHGSISKPIHTVIDGTFIEESSFKPSNTFVKPGLTLGSNYGGQLTAQYGSTSGSQYGSLGNSQLGSLSQSHLGSLSQSQLGSLSQSQLGSLSNSQYGSTSGLGSFATKPIYENQGPQTFGPSSLASPSSLYDGTSSYGGNSFGASVGSYGSSNFYKKELNINNGIYSNHLQGAESGRAENYDCICVPYDQCPAQDVIGRKDDVYLPLDPRNLKSDIEAVSEEERVITDGNGTETVIRIPKGTSLNATVNDDNNTKRVSKREAPLEADNTKDNVEPVSIRLIKNIFNLVIIVVLNQLTFTRLSANIFYAH